MQPSLKAFLSAAAIAFGLSSTTVWAQAAPAQNAQTQQIKAIQPTDAQVNQYVSAARKVEKLVQDYQPRLQAAKDEIARQAIIQEADEKMVAAVQSDGLTVEQYNGISVAVQQDPKLKERITTLFHQGSGG